MRWYADRQETPLLGDSIPLLWRGRGGSSFGEETFCGKTYLAIAAHLSSCYNEATSMKETPEEPQPDAPKKNIVRRLYDWVLSWADTRFGTPALFVLAFLESSFFPIPPDVLQIALSAGKPKRAFWYATVNMVGSVLGAFLGFFIGYVLWTKTPGLQYFFFNYIPGFTEAVFNRVGELYQDNAFVAIFMAAFTPIPYKVFTVAAGVFNISLAALLFGSIIGRGGRFYLIGAIMYFFGPTVVTWIDRYFNLLTIVFAILLVGGFVVFSFC